MHRARAYAKHTYAGPKRHIRCSKAALKRCHGETSRSKVCGENQPAQIPCISNMSSTSSTTDPADIPQPSKVKTYETPPETPCIPNTSSTTDPADIPQPSKVKTYERRPFREVQNITDPVQVPETSQTIDHDPKPLQFSWPVDPDVESHELTVETEEKKIDIDGYRVVDINHVLKWCLTLQSNHSRVCTCSLIDFVKETRDGLRSKFIFRCNSCDKIFHLYSEKEKKINQAFVWGTLTSGSYYAQANTMLSAMDVPMLPAKKFRDIELGLGTIWEQHLYTEMKEAGERERQIAISKGHVSPDGVPYIQVYVDGGWSKRSYGHNFNAASGTACIIGVETKKILFLGVRNKYCCVCAHNEKYNKEKQHVCFRNYTGSSTGMETEMLVEGFTKSIEMHGLRYTSFVGDGDSSVFARLTQKVPYGNIITKKECKNHVTKNYTSALYKIAHDTKLPLAARKILLSKLQKLTAVASMNLKQDNAQKMRQDLQNGPLHVFGDHEKCDTYYCKWKADESLEPDTNLVPSLKQHILFWASIETAIGNVCRKADRLVGNVTNNIAENFMSIMAKFNCGKRLNLTQRGSYNRRAHIAGLSQISGQKWQHKAWQTAFKQRPGPYHQRYLERQEKIAALRASASRKREFHKPAQTESTKSGDKDYGPKADDVPIEIPEMELMELCDKKLKEFQIENLNELEEIQKKTVGQHGNAVFDELRKDRLTASQFGMICKRRSGTPCHNHVKSVLYKNNFANVDTIYGQNNEKVALRLFELQFNKTVIPSGLYIDRIHGFLGASPDGIVVGESALVEIKTFPSLARAGMTLEDAAKTKKSFCLKVNDAGQLQLKQNHNYYYQIQGQLHVANKDKCYLILFISECQPISVLEISKDEPFIQSMIEKLVCFFKECILPEIILRRVPNHHKCREPVK